MSRPPVAPVCARADADCLGLGQRPAHPGAVAPRESPADTPKPTYAPSCSTPTGRPCPPFARASAFSLQSSFSPPPPTKRERPGKVRPGWGRSAQTVPYERAQVDGLERSGWRTSPPSPPSPHHPLSLRRPILSRSVPRSSGAPASASPGSTPPLAQVNLHAPHVPRLLSLPRGRHGSFDASLPKVREDKTSMPRPPKPQNTSSPRPPDRRQRPWTPAPAPARQRP